MQDICCKMSRIAIVVTILVVACVSSAWAATTGFAGGIPWQVRNVAVCFNGTCDMLSISIDTSQNPPVVTVTLLDQFSDGIGGASPAAGTNNTLHLLVADAGTTTSPLSRIVQYSIASVDPFSGLQKAHTVLKTFDAGFSVSGSSNIQGFALDSLENLFIGNDPVGNPATIVELNRQNQLVGEFPLPAVTAPAWQPKTRYALGATILDPDGHVQIATSGGKTGNSPPTWNDNGGQTSDFQVTWTDQGWPVGRSCIDSQLNSLDLSSDAKTAYFTSGPGGIVQAAAFGAGPLSSATCTVVADFGPNVSLSGIRVVPAGSVPFVSSGDGLLVVASGTVDPEILAATPPNTPADIDDETLEPQVDICTGGAPNGPTSCALLLNRDGTIAKTYVIANVNTLKALALDPIISDCITGDCSSVPATPTVANFWVGDGNSANLYLQSFGGGPARQIPLGTVACPPGAANCSIVPIQNIQGLGTYAGETAAQSANGAAITALSNTSLTTTSNTQTVYFPPPLAPNPNPTLNKLTVTSPTFVPMTLNLYASLVDARTGTNDVNSWLCTQSSVPGKCIMWKVDAGSSTARLTQKFEAFNNSLNYSTVVLLDQFFNVTTASGSFDPTSYKTSVHTLYQVPGEDDAGCTYGSPLPPDDTTPPACFQNPNNITFKFTCSNFSGKIGNYAGGHPNLVIVQDPFPTPATPPAPAAICSNSGDFTSGTQCKLSGTGGTTNWRLGNNQWVFNWNVLGQGSYRACTYDPTKVDRPFCTTFIVATTASCP